MAVCDLEIDPTDHDPWSSAQILMREPRLCSPPSRLCHVSSEKHRREKGAMSPLPDFAELGNPSAGS